jgi:hypothetical protein
MAAVVSIQTVDALGAEIYVSFNVNLSGSYVAGGDILNFTSGGTNPAIQDPAYIGLIAAIESSQLLQLDVWSQGGNLINQIVANKVSSNPATGGKIKIGAASGFGTEFSAGAYSAGLLADSLTGFAIFTKML